MFDNEPIREYLARIYSMPGRTDDFRQLSRKLIVVATELDSGVAVRFGENIDFFNMVAHSFSQFCSISGGQLVKVINAHTLNIFCRYFQFLEMLDIELTQIEDRLSYTYKAR